jgi:hypothetical protein
MVSLGAVGGALCVLGFGAVNTYTVHELGLFRNRHAVSELPEHVNAV